MTFCSFDQLAVLSDAEVAEQLRGLDPLARHDALHAVKMARARPHWLQHMRHKVGRNIHDHDDDC